MGKPIQLPWNAAAWRQNTYAPRVTHVPEPICGLTKAQIDAQCLTSGWEDDGTCIDDACQGCGYHVCSCEPVSGSYAALCMEMAQLEANVMQDSLQKATDAYAPWNAAAWRRMWKPT